jgi:hypothetical protein
MKINEIIAYHGSSNNHAGFDVRHTGNNSSMFSDYNSTRYGIFFTTNPKFAEIYGDVMEYELRIQRTIDLDTNNAMNILSDFVDIMFEKDRDIALDARSVLHGDWSIWQLFENDLGKTFVSYLKHLGYDSATFVEEHENDDDEDDEVRGQTIVVFNPSKVIKNGQFELDLYDHAIKAYGI